MAQFVHQPRPEENQTRILHVSHALNESSELIVCGQREQVLVVLNALGIGLTPRCTSATSKELVTFCSRVQRSGTAFVAVITTVFLVFVLLTVSCHITADQWLEAVEVGNGAIVQIVRQLLGLLGPGEDGVHHPEPGPHTPIIGMEEEVYRGTIHPCWHSLRSTFSPRVVRCRNVEIQVIITPFPPFLQSKFNEANHHGLFVRNLQVKFPIVVAEIPGIQIAVPRRGHIAECVGQPHHRQENDFPLKTKMERYR